jgi:hypothetical protein
MHGKVKLRRTYIYIFTYQIIQIIYFYIKRFVLEKLIIRISEQKKK